MPIRVGWQLAIQVFPLGITQERRLKLPSLELIREGGISPCLVRWRGTCPGWLSPVNGDPGSTQILTRHYGAKAQTVSHPVNSWIAPTRQVPIVQPLRVIETPMDGVGAQVMPPSDNS
jgi:hypothetical protein